MPQNATVMAFRKRLKSYGYKEIEIWKIAGYIDLYQVRAKEPLGNQLIRVEMNSTQMHNSFR